MVSNQERNEVKHRKHPEKFAWSEYCNNFEKSERKSIFSFKATHLQHVRLEMEKR